MDTRTIEAHIIETTVCRSHCGISKKQNIASNCFSFYSLLVRKEIHWKTQQIIHSFPLNFKSFLDKAFLFYSNLKYDIWVNCSFRRLSKKSWCSIFRHLSWGDMWRTKSFLLFSICLFKSLNSLSRLSQVIVVIITR